MLKFALISRVNKLKRNALKEKRIHFSIKNEILFSASSNHRLFVDFILRDPVDRGTVSCVEMAISEVNTVEALRKTRGVCHKEGGWPKDVTTTDPEHLSRYRKKIEKGENFNEQVIYLAEILEDCILQNNTLNIYTNFFEPFETLQIFESAEYRTYNVYRDANPTMRQVNHLSWSPDRSSKLAISHCNTNFYDIYTKRKHICESYIWDIEKPNTAIVKLKAHSPILGLEFSQKDPFGLVSGLQSGQVAVWDLRLGKEPYVSSNRSVGHRDIVSSVLWNNSKTGTEFFSGSIDGQVIWWDTRNLNEPLNRLLMDPIKTDNQLLDRSYGISVLEYESSIPTKFMCGTQQGVLFSCNRKGKAPSEKINFKVQSHMGPVRTIIRNPFYVKCFLTVGDWCAKLWVEECREGCVISTKNQRSYLTSGAWSLTKPSLCFLSRQDGVLDCYDILQKINEPLLSIKVCDDPISTIKPHENGKLIAVGNTNGLTYLIEFSENMQHSNKNDKANLTALLERETKREKILESKNRELKLKVRTAMRIFDEEEHAFQITQRNIEELMACKNVEKELFKAIAEEKEARNLL